MTFSVAAVDEDKTAAADYASFSVLLRQEVCFITSQERHNNNSCCNRSCREKDLSDCILLRKQS